MTLLGARYQDAVNGQAKLQVGMAGNEWTEGELTWQNKPALITAAADLAESETFKLGSVVSNDPANITIPEGTVATVDVTNFVAAAKTAGNTELTLVVNVDGSNGIDNVNCIFFVSREGAQVYPNGATQAPTLLGVKYKHVHNLVKTDAKEATKKEEGEKTYTCQICKETKTEVILKLPADPKQDPDPTPTVTPSVTPSETPTPTPSQKPGQTSNVTSGKTGTIGSTGNTTSGTATSGNSKTTAVKTADHTQIALWIMILLAAAGTICGCIYKARKRVK